MKTPQNDAPARPDPSAEACGVRPSELGKGVGVIVAGAAGRGMADEPKAAAATAALDPDGERAYWQAHFQQRHYVEPGSSFSDYGPAYAFGLQARLAHPESSFGDAEHAMSSRWDANRGSSRLSWERARPAAQDAWSRSSDRT